MDRKRNIPNRNIQIRKNQRNPRTNRVAILDRRNRRQGLNKNRNRLFRVQNNIKRNNNNQRGPNRNNRRFNKGNQWFKIKYFKKKFRNRRFKKFR